VTKFLEDPIDEHADWFPYGELWFNVRDDYVAKYLWFDHEGTRYYLWEGHRDDPMCGEAYSMTELIGCILPPGHETKHFPAALALSRRPFSRIEALRGNG
jgi:hypothetical protein